MIFGDLLFQTKIIEEASFRDCWAIVVADGSGRWCPLVGRVEVLVMSDTLRGVAIGITSRTLAYLQERV